MTDFAEITQYIDGTIFGIWFLIGAALVFFMQAGFAMLETGFCRYKNAGNILMKNLMDFCIGTVCFIVLGFGLMMSEDMVAGFVGIPNLQIFTDFSGFMETNASSFVFNLVFCATAATIVSGAVAERIKFSSYCIYSAVLSLVVYPIEAGWVWNPNGWLAKLGFIDFAGSAAIHTVGGVSALLGAIILGPRIGKYVKDKAGKIVKVNAIQGHNIPLGALGCFILWFGWYGFNGAAATSSSQLAAIFLTTTIAPAIATVTALIYTWIKNGKPDVSMCINASLAGLVCVTAGCHCIDAAGAAIEGVISGLAVIIVIEVLDLKFHVDDPVGAVGVHCANGILGTILAGVLATNTSSLGVDGPVYALIHGTDVGDGGQRFLTGSTYQSSHLERKRSDNTGCGALYIAETQRLLSRCQHGLRLCQGCLSGMIGIFRCRELILTDDVFLKQLFVIFISQLGCIQLCRSCVHSCFCLTYTGLIGGIIDNKQQLANANALTFLHTHLCDKA